MDTTTPTKRKIIIVGGGIIGVSSAYYLTQSAKYDQETTEIVIVEGSGIASGASGKAGGLLALDWHVSKLCIGLIDSVLILILGRSYEIFSGSFL